MKDKKQKSLEDEILDLYELQEKQGIYCDHVVFDKVFKLGKELKRQREKLSRGNRKIN